MTLPAAAQSTAQRQPSTASRGRNVLFHKTLRPHTNAGRSRKIESLQAMHVQNNNNNKSNIPCRNNNFHKKKSCDRTPNNVQRFTSRTFREKKAVPTYSSFPFSLLMISSGTESSDMAVKKFTDKFECPAFFTSTNRTQ